VRNWKGFELVWFGVFIFIGTFIAINTKDSLFNYFVLLTGILCVVLAAKGSIWTYFFGIINSFGYAYTAYHNGLFGEVGLNLIFYFPMNILGFFMWKKYMSNDVVIMKGLSFIKSAIVYSACIVSIIILGFLLSLIKGQNTPYIDASTNMIGIVATFLMVWRYKEQWVLYIILNLLTITMWFYRLLNGSSDGSIMVVMWVAFFVNSLYGFYNWSMNAKMAMISEKK